MVQFRGVFTDGRRQGKGILKKGRGNHVPRQDKGGTVSLQVGGPGPHDRSTWEIKIESVPQVPWRGLEAKIDDWNLTRTNYIRSPGRAKTIAFRLFIHGHKELGKGKCARKAKKRK